MYTELSKYPDMIVGHSVIKIILQVPGRVNFVALEVVRVCSTTECEH